ncbi:MAG TPA: hypothetical protein VFD82_12425 [Planctomycetota bacterium]|nr:hypothetical protein [Planctomycetota bacterium]
MTMKWGRTMTVAVVALACILLVPGIRESEPLPTGFSSRDEGSARDLGSPQEAPIASERTLVAAKDEEPAVPAEGRTQSGFSAEEWAVAVELLKTPGTYLVHCEIREATSGGGYLRAQRLEGSSRRSKSRFGPLLDAIAGGDSISIFDNREETRAKQPRLPATAAIRVGDRRWLVIRQVLWREHLLMAGPVR